MTGWRAAAVWLLTLSGILAIILSEILNPDSVIVLLIIALVIGAFGFVGALLVIRLPTNPIGWLLWVTGTGLGWAVAGVAYGPPVWRHAVAACRRPCRSA